MTKIKRTYAEIKYKVANIWTTIQVEGEITDYEVVMKRYELEGDAVNKLQEEKDGK